MTGSPHLPDMRIEIGLSGPTIDDGIWHIGDPIRGQVEVAAIGDDNIWTDVTEYVRSWSFRRGATRGDGVVLRSEAGTCTIELNNGGREFDPTNLNGPYATAGETLLRPMVRVRLTAVWNDVAYRLWTGYADSWTPDYNSTTWSTVTLIATDAFKIFNAIDRTAVAAVGGNELSSARVNRILTGIGWPTYDRQIATGDATVQATTLQGNPLTELQTLVESELGDIYMSVEGDVVFRNRHALLEDARSAVSQATFGDASGGGAYYYDGFESGIGSWGATGGVASIDSIHTQDGTKSLLTEVTGNPTIVYTRKANVPVIAGHRYQLSFWVYCLDGITMNASIDWADGGGYLSTSYTSYDVDSAVPTLLTTTGTAPAGATLAGFGPTIYVEVPETIADTGFWIDIVEFTDLDYEIPYRAAQVQNDDATMANQVTAMINGGTEQTVSDAASQVRYLLKTYSKSDLVLTTDAEALQFAQWVLYQAKDPELRFAQVEFGVPRPDLADVVWATLLLRELGDRVTVIRRPPGGGDPNYRDVFVRGIEMSSDGANWTTQYQLQSATKYQFWTIGSPSLGRIGYNAIGY